MRLASEISKGGMVAGASFMGAITNLIRTEGLKNIIETGSYHGLGTTKAIRDGMTLGELVYSIEVNPEFVRTAINNNRGSGIKFLKGLSVPKPSIPINMTFDYPDEVVVDHCDTARMFKYAQEINFRGDDCLLNYALSKMDYKPDLVILDSAGHLGFIEFKYLMSLVKSDFYLALDDTGHVKHYDTLQYIMSDTDRFKIIFQTNEKFGSAIIRVSIL